MGPLGNPGASPKPFADSRKSTMTVGVDIYMRNPLEYERIETFFVHQTDSITFTELGKSFPCDLDLVNDGGLHSPNATIETLKFGPTKIRIGAWIVVEGIGPDVFLYGSSYIIGCEQL
jgi:hypothetical protein